MNPIIGLLMFIIFPIFMTYWGWKYIIIPHTWPVVKGCLYIFKCIFWFGFCIAIVKSGWFYKVFGFSMVNVIAWMAPTKAEGNKFLQDYEARMDSDGNPWPEWDPHIVKHGPIQPILNPIMSVIVLGIILFLIYLVYRYISNRLKQDEENGR